MLASNFRFGTEDVDIAELGTPWPQWLQDAVHKIALRNGWSEEWLNDGVTFHLSAHAVPARDLVSFGTFPRRSGQTGVTVFVPTARYMLALKLKALRVSDFAKGSKDIDDVRNLLGVLGITEIEPAVAILTEFFPRSGADAASWMLSLAARPSTWPDSMNCLPYPNGFSSRIDISIAPGTHRRSMHPR